MSEEQNNNPSSNESPDPLRQTVEDANAAADQLAADAAADLHAAEQAARGRLGNLHDGMKKKNHSTYAVIGWMVVGGIIGFILGSK